MSAFFDNSITDAGRLLWAEMQAGGVFIPTKIVVGAGYLPSGKTTRTMTAVAEAIQTIALNKNEKMPGGDYIFGGVFSNKDVTEAFYYRELALYAKVERADGTETAETLYSYGNAGASAELIPAYSTGTAVERQLDIITYIGNDATVKVEIATGIYVSKTEFDTKIGALQKAAENSVKKVDGKDLSTNDYTNADKEKVDNLPSDTNTVLGNKVDKVTGKGLSTNDYTNVDKGKVDNLPANTNTALAGKVDKIAGKGLSTNDYTTTEKNKVANLPANTNAELNKKANTSDVYNKSDADERFAKTVTYTATVGTAWTAKTGYVQQTITVNGILATDNPIIDLVTSTADFEAQQKTWGKIFKVTTAANSITLYASEATEKAISLQIKVVR